MKKAKFLLTAIAVVAVTGGALAFKIQKLNTKYCIGPAVGELCPTGVDGMIDPNAPTIAYVTTLNTALCETTCTSIARISGE